MKDRPLDAHEELFWRSLQRVMIALPRVLDDDLLHATGLSLTDYAVLVNLSEAEGRELRMTDLAAATALSASRMTRVVEVLQRRELVTKRRASEDGRGFVAAITETGMQRLADAYSRHLASAREHVIDRLPPRLVGQLSQILADIASDLNPGPIGRSVG